MTRCVTLHVVIVVLHNSIDCRRENELLVGELSTWRVQRLTLKAGS